MLRILSRPATRLMERWLPDAFIFVIVLTLLAALAAVLVQGTGPLQLVRMWGDGFWELLSFSMQMLLVLVTGFILASSPPVRRILARLARLAHSRGGAILLVSVVSLAASWINWGFGLVWARSSPRNWRARSASITACWWPRPIPALSSGMGGCRARSRW